MPSNSSIREQVTKQITAAIEQNQVLPWRRPWLVSKNAGRPANVVSKNVYSGVNPLLLQVHSEMLGFQSRWWGTYRQWQSLDCGVKRRPAHVPAGEWGAKIVFYKPITKRMKNEAGEDEVDRFFILRQFTVFNADQVDGADRFQADDVPAADTESLPNFDPAEELIAATGAKIQHGGQQAFYSRLGDFIQMPHKHLFSPAGSYYETAFHELAHWSEHRMGWDHQQHGYDMGELVAEIAASFLSTELGVPQAESLENHAAYLKSWLAGMLDDTSFIFKASTQASKVADFLLAFRDAKQPESTEPIAAQST